MLERTGRGGEGAPPEQARSSAVDQERANAIICAQCRAKLTTPDQRLEVQGAHAHTFTNPAGETFHVRCFAEMRNLAALGTPEAFFTWFPGHTWRIVICASCSTFLGWRFEGSSVFHGLIADRIAETP